MLFYSVEIWSEQNLKWNLAFYLFLLPLHNLLVLSFGARLHNISKKFRWWFCDGRKTYIVISKKCEETVLTFISTLSQNLNGWKN